MRTLSILAGLCTTMIPLTVCAQYSYEETELCCAPTSCKIGTVEAGALCGRLFVDGLQTACGPFVIVDTVDTAGDVDSTISEPSKKVHFNWNAGYYVGLTAYLPSDWSIAAYWTHLNSTAHQRNDLSRLHWKGSLDYVDLLADYNWQVTPCFKVIPQFGLRFAYFHQHLHREQDADVTTIEAGTTTELVGTSVTRAHQTDWGVGPEVGLAFNWDVGCGFGLYADVNGGVLYGDIKTKRKTLSAYAASESFIDVHDNATLNLGFAHGEIGLEWHKQIYSYNTQTYLAWEHERFFDANRLGAKGDLAMDALILSFQIEY